MPVKKLIKKWLAKFHTDICNAREFDARQDFVRVVDITRWHKVRSKRYQCRFSLQAFQSSFQPTRTLKSVDKPRFKRPCFFLVKTDDYLGFSLKLNTALAHIYYSFASYACPTAQRGPKILHMWLCHSCKSYTRHITSTKGCLKEL